MIFGGAFLEVVEKSIGTCYLKMPKTVILLEQESEKWPLKCRNLVLAFPLQAPKPVFTVLWEHIHNVRNYQLTLGSYILGGLTD